MSAAMPDTDPEGFLVDHQQWSEAVATHLAASAGLSLGDDHWRIIHAARDFYREYQRSPDMRPLVNWVKSNVGASYGTSIALMTLFPGRTARLVSQIAGLPKPPNCL